jgi:hypothetical protein
MSQSRDIMGRLPLYTGYTDILAVKTPQELTEMSMARIFQYFQGEDSFAVVSAMKDYLSPEENYRRTGQLQDAVRRLGYGYFGIRGVGQDSASGTRIEEMPLFIPKITKAHATMLGGMFDQFSVLYHGLETGPSTVWEVRVSDGGVERQFHDFHPDKLADFYSVWRGKTFTFESLPTDNSERRARAKIKLPGMDI